MAIVNNIACPECQRTGHDKTGNHLIIYEDGAGYCNRAHFHESGKPYYQSAEGGTAITDLPIRGDIKYSPTQFKELEKSGKLTDTLRAIALGGMRFADRWEVMNEQERIAQQAEWKLDVEHYGTLQYRHLISRHIHGQFAKFYGVAVGFDESQQVARHYYPRYERGELVGAKCRTLPKDFRFGHLGKLFGKQDLQGSQTMKAVADTGRRMDTLLITGGELDMVAAQQMLFQAQAGTKFKDMYYHVWSVNKGETCMQELIDNKEEINQFKKVIWCFDDDEAGLEAARGACRLFPGKSYVLKLPLGCKDPNKALMAGQAAQFVDAYFNAQPADVMFPSVIKSIASQRDLLKEAMPAPGLSWPWPELNKITLGIRTNQLIVVAAGSGVGKTEFLREVVYCMNETHGERVGIISTEDPYKKVARAYIGKFGDKRIELPPTNDPTHEDYRKILDYTKEEADAMIDYVADQGLMHIVDMKGDYSMDNVVRVCIEMVAMGIRTILIDNLTGIKMDEKAAGGKVNALDEAVKILGNLKDDQDVTIFLVTHLSRPGPGRVPHEEGGYVALSDLRGSGAIGFWASYVLAARRNTKAESLDERITTFIECVKDRDQGIFTGESITLKGDLDTGRLRSVSDYHAFIQDKNESASLVPNHVTSEVPVTAYAEQPGASEF